MALLEYTASASAGDCLTPSRVWLLAAQPRRWTFEESEHLRACTTCQARVKEAMASLTERRDARRRYATALLLLAAAAKLEAARTALRLPRPKSPVNKGATTIDIDDNYTPLEVSGDVDLTASVKRTDDGRYLLTIQHDRLPPGRLVLAVVSSAEGSPLWSRWLMLHAPRKASRARVRLDEAALPGDNYPLDLKPDAPPTAQTADILRLSFQDAQADDKKAIPVWQAWARETLEAGVAEEALRHVIEEIRDASPLETDDEDPTKLA